MLKKYDEIRNSFEQEMIDNGYRIFNQQYKNALRLFEKKFTDDNGIKYYIHVYHYNHREQIGNNRIPEGDSYQANSQMTKNDMTFDLDVHGPSFIGGHIPTVTLEQMEQHYEDYFQKMEMDYYEEY